MRAHHERQLQHYFLAALFQTGCLSAASAPICVQLQKHLVVRQLTLTEQETLIMPAHMVPAFDCDLDVRNCLLKPPTDEPL